MYAGCHVFVIFNNDVAIKEIHAIKLNVDFSWKFEVSVKV